MDRSRTDRILEDWDMVTTHVERPPEPPRPSTVRTLIAPTAGFAALAIVALAVTAIWLGRPDQGIPVIGGSPSPTTAAAVTPTPTPSGSAGPSPSGSPAGSPSPAASPSPSDTLGAFTCGYPFTLAGTASGPTQAEPTTVRVGTHAGYDRIAFEYGSATLPTVSIEPVSPPFTHDPSGLPMTVAGSSFLRIRLEGVAMGYAGPTDLRLDGTTLVELAREGDYEGIQTWIVGLKGPACIRVFTLAGPDRLVIDLQ